MVFLVLFVTNLAMVPVVFNSSHPWALAGAAAGLMVALPFAVGRKVYNRAVEKGSQADAAATLAGHVSLLINFLGVFAIAWGGLIISTFH